MPLALPAHNRRVPMQWFSVSRLAAMLDVSPRSVRQWWRAGGFGPPAGESAADYFFVMGEGRGSDVRISVRGYEHFLASHAPEPVQVVVMGRTPGEARRALDAVG